MIGLRRGLIFGNYLPGSCRPLPLFSIPQAEQRGISRGFCDDAAGIRRSVLGRVLVADGLARRLDDRPFLFGDRLTETDTDCL